MSLAGIFIVNFLMFVQYQMSATMVSTTKQNGGTHGIKTTTIQLSSKSPDTVLSTNTNSNNSNAAESSKNGLPGRTSVKAPAKCGVVELDKKRSWRAKGEKELDTEPDKVCDFISDVAADKQSKPTSDML